MTKLRILITNDDGIRSDGIWHLWNSLKDHADTYIVAPLSEKSGSGVSHTLTKPLQIRPFKWKSAQAWTVNGTPADCVKIALSEIFRENAPDLIVSGINHGSNAGRSVLHSGTVGGVIEGVIRNIPGIAFSCFDFHDPHFEEAAKFIYPIVKHFIKHPLPQGSLLNVNFPKRIHGKVKGFKMARQGKSHWIDNPDRRLHPEGTPYFWLGGRWNSCDEHEESDVSLLERGFMTAVPIHVNEMTDHTVLDHHRELIQDLFNEVFIEPIEPG